MHDAVLLVGAKLAVQQTQAKPREHTLQPDVLGGRRHRLELVAVFHQRADDEGLTPRRHFCPDQVVDVLELLRVL